MGRRAQHRILDAAKVTARLRRQEELMEENRRAAEEALPVICRATKATQRVQIGNIRVLLEELEDLLGAVEVYDHRRTGGRLRMVEVELQAEVNRLADEGGLEAVVE